LPADPLNYELEKLKAEAQSKFRTRKVREDQSDGYFVRHALFPRVIKSLYNDSCAVFRLTVTTPIGASIVDAVHIMPFGVFRNDDPRNGMTLCKDHHRAFDVGGIAVDQDYQVIVSKHLTAPVTFVPPHASLLLPTDRIYAPAQEALA
jgi:putative restriction endonuclease